MLKKWDKTTVFLIFFYSLIILTNGLYFGFEKALALILLAGFFFVKIIKKQDIYLPKDGVIYSLIVLLILTLSGFFYYVEKGMNIYSVLTVFTCIIAYVFTVNIEPEKKKKLRVFLVFLSIILSLFILVFSFTKAPQELGYIVKDEFAGPFQYSNSFALFLLLSLHFILEDESLFKEVIKKTSPKIFARTRELRLAFAALILISIYFAHSLIILALTALYLLLFLSKKIKNKQLVYALFTLAILGSILYLFLSVGSLNALIYSSRFSSLKTRFIYYKDAISMIKAHPFGYGYMGYYFAQHAFQTSYDYNTIYVHNLPLQLVLDFGILGFLAASYFLVSIFKKVYKSDRIIFIIMILATFLDFHMQYLAFVFIAFLLVNDKFKENVIKKRRIFGIILIVIFILADYVLVFDLAMYLEHYEMARMIYPEHTFSLRKDIDEVSADECLELVGKNEYLYPAYKRLTEYYLTQGQLDEAIYYARQYRNYNELGDFKENFYIDVFLDIYKTGAYDELASYISLYENEIAELKKRKGTKINIKHEFDFNIDRKLQEKINKAKNK